MIRRSYKLFEFIHVITREYVCKSQTTIGRFVFTRKSQRNMALSGEPLLFISVIHRLVSPNVKVNIYAFESINERRLAR